MTETKNERSEPLAGSTDLIDQYPTSRPTLPELADVYREEDRYATEREIFVLLKRMRLAISNGQSNEAEKIAFLIIEKAARIYGLYSSKLNNALKEALNFAWKNGADIKFEQRADEVFPEVIPEKYRVRRGWLLAFAFVALTVLGALVGETVRYFVGGSSSPTSIENKVLSSTQSLDISKLPDMPGYLVYAVADFPLDIVVHANSKTGTKAKRVSFDLSSTDEQTHQSGIVVKRYKQRMLNKEKGTIEVLSELNAPELKAPELYVVEFPDDYLGTVTLFGMRETGLKEKSDDITVAKATVTVEIRRKNDHEIASSFFELFKLQTEVIVELRKVLVDTTEALADGRENRKSGEYQEWIESAARIIDRSNELADSQEKLEDLRKRCYQLFAEAGDRRNVASGLTSLTDRGELDWLTARSNTVLPRLVETKIEFELVLENMATDSDD